MGVSDRVTFVNAPACRVVPGTATRELRNRTDDDCDGAIVEECL
jgi:hypothetical protein